MSGDGEKGPYGPDYIWLGKVLQTLDQQGIFWMQLGTSESLEQFQEMVGDLVRYCCSNFTPTLTTNDLRISQAVLVDSGAGPCWKRGLVTGINESTNRVEVSCFDYGYTEVLSIRKICTKFPPQFEALPPQAVRCKLAGVQPIGKTWTSRGIKTFQGLTNERTMKVLVLPGERDYCNVALYTSEEEEYRSVAHGLLDEDVAMPIDDVDVPEYLQIIPDSTSPVRTGTSIQTSTPVGMHEPDIPSPSKPVAASPEKYIPPHQKTLSTSPGVASPGSSLYTTPPSNSKYATPNVNGQYGATPGNGSYGTPPNDSNHSNSNYVSPIDVSLYSTPPGYSQYSTATGYGKQPSSNKQARYGQYAPPLGYSQQALPQGYSQQATPPRYGQQASPGYRQTSPPKVSHQQQNNSRSPNKSLPSPNSEFKLKEPVNDFFPFETVSIYPPSPNSPIKSPEKGSSSGGTHGLTHGQGSYFSQRSPKVTSSDDTYTNSNTNNSGRYSENAERQSASQSIRTSGGRPHGKSRLSANFDNLPNTFEPSFMNQQQGSNSTYTSPAQNQSRQMSYNNPETDGSLDGSHSKPRPHLNIPSPYQNSMPFYPPKPREEFAQVANMISNKPTDELIPPGYYQSHAHGEQDSYNQSSTVYTSPSTNSHQSMNQFNTHPGYNSSHTRNGPNPSSRSMPLPPTQQLSSTSSTYEVQSRTDSYEGLSASVSHPSTKSHYGPVGIPSHTPTKHHPGSYQGYDGYKHSPESPESPAIAGFNFSDLDHTHMLSKDHLNEKMKKERLAALQEEQEVIARETEEQSELVNIARYGMKSSDKAGRYNREEDESESWPDIVEEISQEIRYTTETRPQEYEDLRTTPIKKTSRRSKGAADPPLRQEKGHLAYISDVNFAEAVKQTLEYAMEDGQMENTKALLDGIIESLKSADMEKELYDVLLLMLAYAIKEYDIFHRLLMDTINSLYGEMEIKACLLKALRRQQELQIRVGHSKHQSHQHFARIIGHVFNMAVSWNDSNTSIQDYVVQMVEKWLLFNCKGQQSGQQEKENIFLDCFEAFWELSETSLLHHTDAFPDRLYADLTKKILNENISRCVRERLLLDVYPKLYPVNASTDKENACTQTDRKTMIPSSCQVKPVMNNAATYTETDWQDDRFWNVDPDTAWQDPGAQEYNSPDQGVSLRPLGMGRGYHTGSIPPAQGISFQTSRSTQESPTYSEKTIGRGKTGVTERVRSKSEDGVSQTNTDRIINESKTDLREITSEKTVTKTEMKKALSGGASQSIGHNVGARDTIIEQGGNSISNSSRKERKGSPKASPSDKSTDSQGLNDSMSEKFSAAGRSIVDWFDYEPSGNASSVVKLEEKKLKTKKRLDSASMNIIENEIETKYSVAKSSDLKAGKARKEKKKGSKADELGKAELEGIAVKATEGNSAKTDKSDNDIGAVKRDAKSCGSHGNNVHSHSNRGENNHGNNRTNEGHNSANKADIRFIPGGAEEEEENWDKGFSSVEKVTERIWCEPVNKNIDWWGEGEPTNVRVIHGVTDSCDIYTDLDPDVIIEDEFEQDVTDIVETLQLNKESSQNSQKLEDGNEANIRETYSELEGNIGATYSELEGNIGATYSELEGNIGATYSELEGNIGATFSEHEGNIGAPGARYSEHGENIGTPGTAKLLADVIENRLDGVMDNNSDYKDDMFAFEVDETWEGSDDDDFEFNGRPDHTYEADFPSSDMHAVVRPPDSTSSLHEVADNYEQNFPRSNLSDFIRTEEVVEDRSARPRWVPGPRKCLSCHETGHMTENCPNKFLLLQ